MILKEGKTNWKHILIVVILTLITEGGILWWINQQEFSIEFPEIKKPEKIVEKKAANWKTYRNEEHGFEFKYPKEWEKWDLREDEYPKETPDQWLPLLIIGLFYDGKYDWKGDFCIMNMTTISKNDFNDIINDYRSKTYAETLTNIGGINGVRFEYVDTTPSISPPLEKNIEIFFDKENNHYHIYIQSYRDRHEIECKNLINQILSTLKFLE